MLTLREKHEYEQEIAELKLSLSKEIIDRELEFTALKKELEKSLKSKHNLQYRFNCLNASVYKERGSRTTEAKNLVRLRDLKTIKITLKEIAKKTNLAYSSVLNISSAYNSNKAQ